ncbi:seminal metalloprotease 1-like [Uranotaenia lowii]|uniref:seminal metalloprotease 1-like n=1 Tax=Uranotaenia lowii TaxID=190385 RepID=UPI002479413F|nr:seminal metalloprotease 1-like [Uranotaenia lowii]
MRTSTILAASFLAITALIFSVEANYDYSAETRSGNYEGDLVLNQRQLDTAKSGRNPVVTPEEKWINNLVPYVVEENYFSPENIRLIREAMNRIEEVSFIQFRPRKSEQIYLVVSGEPTGCWSTLGRHRGPNRMNLSPAECMREGSVVHQLLHVLGFGHETNSVDRDFFMDIVYQNIEPSLGVNLRKYDGFQFPDFGISMDMDSILHFGWNHFSLDGSQTIYTKERNATLGQRESLSLKDIRKLNMMYKCSWC